MQLSTTETACRAPGGSPGPDTPPTAPGRIVVLGIGNLLWADEGFGVRCVEALQDAWEFADHVELVDGGTQGIALMSLVQSAQRLLILDAVDYGREPGELVRVEGEAVPRFLASHKMSLHQTGFQEVLMLSLLCGRYPDSVLLVGCQPEWLDDYGGSLRPRVRAAMGPALDMALAALQAWGAEPRPRQEPRRSQSPLSLQAYEDGRPDEHSACRIGDARFMPVA
jgi:hydrogenase maturation protease